MIALHLERIGTVWFSLFGLVVGSFLNVVIYRVPRGFALGLPSRSACPSCGRRLAWLENVPVLSYLCLRGRCAGCGTPIGARYPLVEMMTAVLFFAVYRHFGLTFTALYYCAFAAALLAVTFIDLDFRIIPDRISIGGAALALLASFWVEDLGIVKSAMGAAIGAGFVFSLAWAYNKLTNREGMGLGDVKLLAFIGAALGPKGAIGTIILSSFVGSIVGLILIAVYRRDLRMAVPFGPFLAIGALIFLFWGDSITLTLYPFPQP